MSIIELTLLDLAVVYSLLLITIALSHFLKAKLGKSLFCSGLRMLIQLMTVGYVLDVVFALESPAPVLLVLLLMIIFAVQTVGARVETKMPNFYRIVTAAMLMGCGVMTFFFCTFIVSLEPWYDPRYLIPLAGMVIGNSMTGASLASERLAAEFRERRDEIETALCLGSSIQIAAESAVSSAFRVALIPSVNAMAAMGLVFLPGMMTGQILSGTEPILAVKYQIAIMAVITGSVALTTFMILRFGYRSYFTPYQSLREEK